MNLLYLFKMLHLAQTLVRFPHLIWAIDTFIFSQALFKFHQTLHLFRHILRPAHCRITASSLLIRLLGSP